MNTYARKIVSIFAVVIALGLSACGGESDPIACNAGNPEVNAILNPGGCASVTSAETALFTTAPSAITLNAGSSATYTVDGGAAPYIVTSGNTSAVTTSLDGTVMTVSGISSTTSSFIMLGGDPSGSYENVPVPVSIVDSNGKSLTVMVTVLAAGQAGVPPSISPSAITVGVCTTNIPFIFVGGTAPFTIYTSDTFEIPVSGALPLGADSYFTASVKDPTPLTKIATVTVLDSQARSAVATITIPKPNHECPANPLLQTLPASANMRVSEILAFQVSGGPVPAQNASFTFSDSSVAKLVRSSSSTFEVQALAVGATLLTVTSADGQNANIPINVFPQAVAP